MRRRIPPGRRQRAALPASDPLRLQPELIRPCLAALILAFAFASLARGRSLHDDQDDSLLDQLLFRLRVFRQLPRRRIGAPSQLPDADYLCQLQGDDQE